MSRTTPQAHRLQEPTTGLYYTARPDGEPALTPKPATATAFTTAALAIEYATLRLAGQACEVVRVT